MNEALWELEDQIRAAKDEGEVAATALSICRMNDRRCKLKQSINSLLGAGSSQEKMYGKQEDDAAAVTTSFFE